MLSKRNKETTLYDKVNEEIYHLKQYFCNIYFILVCMFAGITEIIFLMGNPQIDKIPIHYIPEIIGFYLIGYWQHLTKTPFKYLLLSYFIIVFLAFIINPYYPMLYYLIPVILAFPMLIGYMLAEWGITE